MTDITDRLKTRFDPRIVQPDEMAREAHAEIERLRAALQRLLDWNEGIAAGRGNHYPREHADVARAALAASR